MSANREIADLLEQAAQLVELTGGNRFRAAAYQRGARVLRDLSEDVAKLADKPDQLTDIDGIGKGLAEKIIEYVRTKHIEEVDALVASVPAGVLEVMQVPGIGPKTAAVMWKQGGIESIADLKAAIESGDLEKLPRMGAKSVEKIRKSLAFAESAGQRKRIGDAMPMALYFLGKLAPLKAVKDVDYAGSLRRGKETIGDIDILVASEDAETVTKRFGELDVVEEVIGSGSTKTSVRVEGGMQVDLRIVRPDRYGAALTYFTGSKEHNVALRQRAIDRDLRLNEYGLWHTADAERMDEAEPVAAKTEADLYAALDLPYIPPELREDRGEISAAERGKLPTLIDIEDIRCELHAHTTASDGVMSIEELASEARDRGFHTVAVTDHSGSQVQANGLDAKRLAAHAERVREADSKIKGIKLLAGTEVDILADGKLDYPNSVLKELDIVVASPHSALSQDTAAATRRLLRAIENPYVHIIGHPTGRLIGRREGLAPDLKPLLKAAKETGTALELNANPWRLDLRDVQVKAAMEAGVMIAINTDAHRPADLDLLVYGVMTARRGWVEAGRVVNTFDAQALTRWLAAKRKKMGV